MDKQKLLLTTLRKLKRGFKTFSGEQKTVIYVLYRKAFVSRDVGTLEYHMNERGEDLLKKLESYMRALKKTEVNK